MKKLTLLLLLSLMVFAADDHADKDGEHVGGDTRPQGQGAQSGENNCPVSVETLSQFANGEGYDFPAMVSFLSRPGCEQVANTKALETAKYGVSWSRAAELRLDSFANSLLKNGWEGSFRVDKQLIQMVPEFLRTSSRSSEELYPLLGQLALLSPKSARMVMANLIEKELYNSDSISSKSRDPKELDQNAEQLAKGLLKYGAAESQIANELADSVEEKALTAQADSLGKIFRGLASASRVESALVPTFNLTAGAVNRGVQRGKNTFAKNSKKNLSAGLIESLDISLKGPDALEPGIAELNEALAVLLAGGSLEKFDLNGYWKEIIQMLAKTTGLDSLGVVVAVSITPSVLFIKDDERSLLLKAGLNYPEIARSLQRNYLIEADRMYADLHEGRMKVREYNRFKAKYLETWASDLLGLEPAVIEPVWVRTCFERGYMSDGLVEKKLPRLVLTSIKRREKALDAMNDRTLDGQIMALSENLAILWANSTAYIPVLMKWVARNGQ